MIEREEPDQVEQTQPEVEEDAVAAEAPEAAQPEAAPPEVPEAVEPERGTTEPEPEPESAPPPPAAEAEAPATEPEEPAEPAQAAEAEQPRTLTELAAGARYFATGKRKCSVARVIIRPGSGQFNLNGRVLEDYFPRPTHQAVVRQPLDVAGYGDRIDVRARIHGGGISGQADAVRHGIAKALIEADPALRPELKRRQLLTRDPREKERRKAGLKKARKRPQFSKR